MTLSAKLSKILFGVLVGNAILIVAVSALRPVLANQQAESPNTTAPEVQIPPSDPPSLPPTPEALQTAVAATAEKTATEPATGAAPSASEGPANKMVLDEILKTIQQGRGELDVPPLSFPPIVPATSGETHAANIEMMSQRLKSMSELIRSAQTLVKEAELLQSRGNAAAARELVEHVRTLKVIIVQLAAEEVRVPAPAPQ